MWKTLTFVLASLLIGVFLVFGYFFVNGMYSTSSDNRRLIELAPAEKDLVLGEMRSMLKAVNGVIDALATKDMAKAADAASSAGMGMAVDVNPVLMAKLPLDFKELGMGTHAQFDELAAAIRSGADQESVLKSLSGITSRCVACHEVNRLSMTHSYSSPIASTNRQQFETIRMASAK